MSGDTVLTIIGNLVAAPELRFTPSGAAVANFTVASTPRVFDRQSNDWKDGDTLFMRCAVWREAAENVAESLDKGMRVIVQGRLKQRSYDTKEGEKRTVVELDVDEVGPSLRYASAKVNRNAKGSGNSMTVNNGGQRGPAGGGRAAGPQGGGFGGGPQSGPQGGGGFGGQSNASDDVWNKPSGGGNYDWGAGQEEEPPF